MHTFRRRRKSTAEPLGRSPGLEGANRTLADSRAASPSPADGPSGYSKRRAFTYSGGTAPDFHRTSLLCPSWAPKASEDASTPGHSAPNLFISGGEADALCATSAQLGVLRDRRDCVPSDYDLQARPSQSVPSSQ